MELVNKMASPLDLGFLSNFSNLFLALFLFVAAYATLTKTKILGENKTINFIAAMMLAFLVVISPAASEMIKILTPAFSFFAFVLITIVVLFMFVGVKADSITNAFRDPAVYWFIIVVFLLFLLYAATVVYGERIRGLTVTSEEGVDDSVVASAGKVVFHPKVLTGLLIFSIIAFAIRYMVTEHS